MLVTHTVGVDFEGRGILTNGEIGACGHRRQRNLISWRTGSATWVPGVEEGCIDTRIYKTCPALYWWGLRPRDQPDLGDAYSTYSQHNWTDGLAKDTSVLPGKVSL